MAIGAGWQALIANVNIVCYYVFGIPMGLLLGYKINLGVKVSSLIIQWPKLNSIFSFNLTYTYWVILGDMVWNGGWNSSANHNSILDCL